MRTGRVFPVLTFFALMYCDWVSARFKAIAEESPVAVAVGDTALLRCRTSIPYELKDVRWFRNKGGHYSIINLFRDGRDQQRCDDFKYVGRTWVMKEGLVHGHAALKVFDVSVADEGMYRCYLETVDYFDSGDLNLTVTDGLFRKSTDVHTIVLALGLVLVFSLAAVIIFGILSTWRKNEQGVSCFGLKFCIRRDSSRIQAIREQLAASVDSSDLDTMLSSVTINEVSPEEEEPIGCESSSVTQALPPLGSDSEEDLHTMLSSVTIKEVSPKEEPIGCESSPLTQARLPPGPDSEDVSSAANAEARHLNVSPEEGSTV